MVVIETKVFLFSCLSVQYIHMYVYSQLVQSRVKVIFVPDYTCFILCLDVCLRPCIRESTTSYLSTYTVLVILVFAVTVRTYAHSP